MSSTKEILGMFRKVYEGQSQVENIDIIENKLKLKIYNVESELEITDKELKTNDGFDLRRTYSLQGKISYDQREKDENFFRFVNLVNLNSTLSSFIYFSEDNSLKFKSRYFEYDQENTNMKDFQIETMMAQILNNSIQFENTLNGAKESFQEFRDKNFKNLDIPRAIENGEFLKSIDKYKSSYAINGDKEGLTVEFPLDKKSYSKILGSEHNTSLLQVLTDNTHPIFGRGISCRLTLPVNCKSFEQINNLNKFEYNLEDAPPFFGSWCSQEIGKHIAFICFIPNDLYTEGLVDYLIIWMMIRSEDTYRYLMSN
jgi:hypothetical protein